MINWLAIAFFLFLTLAAARRLLLLWLETRELPELMIAILILGVGTVAVCLGFVVRTVVSPGALRDALLFAPYLGAGVGIIALSVFTWRVYRPGSGIARLATVGVSSSLAVLICHAAFSGSSQILEAGIPSIINSSLYVGVMAWSATEAFLYWNALRKRMRIGLADPLVTNRVLLWGVATGMAAMGTGIGAAAQHFAGVIEFQNSWVTLCYAGHGLVAAIGFWLAFNPPKNYVRWIVGDSGLKEAAL